MNFKVKAPEYELLNLDYTQMDWGGFPADTVFYFDPPYYMPPLFRFFLITSFLSRRYPARFNFANFSFNLHMI